MTYTIKVSFDTTEAEQYVEWLNAKGHNAEIGRESSDEVDGESAFSSEAARAISERLWSEYCNAN